jgi:pyruvate/2-oxoglutarate/acetoin dehydrogenase E1 component
MLEFRVALNEAMAEELAADPAVLVIGEDVAAAGGVFKVTEGLVDRFGPDRVVDTPISELALAGAAFGGAIMGLRPVVEIMFGDFIPLVMDGLINQAAKYRYLTGGKHTAPLVVRSAVGAGGRFGAIHSQNPGIWLHGVPGLKVVCPSSPADAKALLRASIRDDDPVLFLEHKRLYRQPFARDPFPPADYRIPLGSGDIVQAGTDLTIVTYGYTVHLAKQAAAGLDASVEIVDLRCLIPWDKSLVAESVARTGRVLVVHEDIRTAGFGAEIAAWIACEAFDHLDAPVRRVGALDTHVGYAPVLEKAILPQTADIADAARSLLQY